MQTIFKLLILPGILFFFSFTFLNNLSAQNAPSLNPISNINLSESATPTEQPVNLTGINDNDGYTQTITITASSNNTSLIPDPAETYTSPNTTGSLAFTPVANAHGQATITVTVDDGVDTPGTVTFTVYVNGAPDFTSSTSADFNENGTGTVIDVNADDPESNSIAFSIQSDVTDNNLFSIDATSGILTFINPPDYENTGHSNVYTVTATATDNGSPANYSTQTITITVNNVNEAPVIDALQIFDIDENSAIGTSVGTVLATDVDVPTTLTYSITSGNNLGMFAIDASNGEITAASAAIDYETTIQYILGIHVTDGTLADDETVTVNINNVNEAPVIDALQIFDIDENSAIGTSVGTVLATDVDVPTTLTYSITSGNNTGMFAINSSTGAITAASDAIDYETTAQYILGIHVTDGSLADDETVTVNINNVNEAPVFTSNNPVPVNENQTATLTIEASDPESNPITYYLPVGTGDNNLFSITPSSGILTFNSAPDFESPADSDTNNSYLVTVVAADNQTPAMSNSQTITITVNNINEAPVFTSNNDVTVDENQTATLTVTASDPESNPVTYSLPAGTGDNNLFTINSTSGVLTFNTAPDFENPTDSDTNNIYLVTVVAADNQTPSLSNNQDLTITVNNVNEVPTANNDTYSVNEDNTLSINAPGVINNDTDEEDDNLIAYLRDNVSNGNLTFNPDGSFTYSSKENYNGTDQFSYYVNDGNSNSTDATVTIIINPQNDTPVAYDDTYNIIEDHTLTVNTPGVLANDIDIDDNSLTATLISTTSNGTLTLNPNGSFTYQPILNFAGIDSFRYAANDGSKSYSNTATVTINVGATNDPPVSQDDTYKTNEDETLIVELPGILSNDTDPDNNSLSVILVSNVSHGTLNLNTNGSFSYSPNSNYHGNDNFTYKASDSQVQGNTSTVNINISPVNDYPVAVDDYFYTAEDIPDNIIVTTNDKDLNDSQNGGINETSISIISQAKHGTAFIIGNKINYTPYSRFYGEDTLSYVIFDSGYPLPPLSDTAYVFIQVARRHPLAVDDDISINEDNTIDINVLQNDLDLDINPASVTIGTPPLHGSVVVNSTNGIITYAPNLNYFGTDENGDSFTYTVKDMTGLSSDIANVNIDILPVPDSPTTTDVHRSTPEDIPITIQLDVLASDPDNDLDPSSVEFITNPTNGTKSNNNTNGAITYEPNHGFSGTDTLTFRISDLLGNVSNISSIIINVSDEAPNAINDTINISEDQTIYINVLANDTDPQDNIVADSVRITILPTHGIVIVNKSTGILTYTPDENFNGNDIFTYSIADATNYHDQAQVIINITPVNDPPVAINDTIKSQEDQNIEIDIFNNDYDIDNLIDSTLISIPSPPTHGQVTFDATTHLITFIPEPNYYGNDSLKYEVFDEEGASSQGLVFISLTAIPDPPEAEDDNFITNEETEVTINVVLNDIDIENDIDTCSLDIVGDPLHGTVTVLPTPNCGNISYTPDNNYFGTDYFIYQISDTSGLSGQATAYITINNTPDAPVAIDDNYTTPEDSTLIMNVLFNDYDPDNNIDSTQLSILDTPENGTLEITNNRIIYVPASNFNGTDQFKYQICDSTNLHDSAFVYINITPINDAPVAVDDYDKTVSQLNIKTNVAENDIDVDNNLDLYSIIVISQPLHGSVAVENGTGYIIYTPTPNVDYYGLDSYDYRICDTYGACDTATVFLEITSGNVAPITQPDYVTTDEDTPVSISPANNDKDPNDNLDITSITIAKEPDYGTATSNALLSQITYEPNLNFNGTDTILYSICDLAEPPLCSVDTIIITVNPVNDSPVAAQRNIQSFDNSTVDIDVLSYCSDPENDPLTVSISESSPVINGIVSVNEDNTIRYESAEGIYCTSEQIIYEVCDDDGLCATASIFITLVPTDSDGDNIPDDVEKDGDPDGDGTPNYLDDDSDGDGISDFIEGAINDPCSDVLPDTDGDSTPDYLDTDSDNDGVPDIDEGYDDCDNDGIPDYQDIEDDCVERLDVPDTFSPNGDGINDYFKIPGANELPNDELYVYNRWGGLVFESKNYDNSWDGKSSKNLLGTSELTEGTYFYIYKPDDSMQVFKGTVYLKR